MSAHTPGVVLLTRSANPRRDSRAEGADGVDYGLASSVCRSSPNGGFKTSGYGKDLSMPGFEDYTRVKHGMSHLGE